MNDLLLPITLIVILTLLTSPLKMSEVLWINKMWGVRLGATSNKLETNLRLTPQTFLYKPKGASHVSNVRGVCYWFVKFVILTPLTCYKTSNILTSPKVMLVGDVIVTLTYTPNIPKECQGCLLEGFVWVSDVR